MDLGSEIRNSIIMSAIGGFLMGISLFVSDTILTILPTDSISWDSFAQLVGFVVFLIGVFIVVEAWRKKSSIVADVEMELDIARRHAHVNS